MAVKQIVQIRPLQSMVVNIAVIAMLLPLRQVLVLVVAVESVTADAGILAWQIIFAAVAKIGGSI